MTTVEFRSFLVFLSSAARRASVILAFITGSAAALAKDVHIGIMRAWPEPADIVITLGDRVVWEIEAGISSMVVYDLEGGFESGVLGDADRRFIHLFPAVGLYGYEHYDGVRYRGRGMVEVLAPDPGDSELMLNAPIRGATFPIPINGDGTQTPTGAWLPLQASAAATNGLLRIEYRFAGATVAVATNWPFRTLAQTFLPGTNGVTATAIYEDGRRITSSARTVVVQPVLFTEGGVFSVPVRLRGDLNYVEYRTAGGGPWLLRLNSGLGAIPQDPPPTVFEFNLRGVHGGWGRFPLPAIRAHEFLFFDRRF